MNEGIKEGREEGEKKGREGDCIMVCELFKISKLIIILRAFP